MKNTSSHRKNRNLNQETGSLDIDNFEMEEFPRQISFLIKEKRRGNTLQSITMCNGIQIGDPLTDNAYHPDGYRFHDVFHMSYLAVLGWSPVLRKQLKRKRKSNPKTDEVEDGGRAAAIEEGISALVFSYARSNNFFETSRSIDIQFLNILKNMTLHLEVASKSTQEWERAILKGYRAWRALCRHRQGWIHIDLRKGQLTFKALGNNDCDGVAA